jgi:protein TonB
MAQARVAPARDTTVSYLDSNRQRVSTQEKASYRVKTVPTDSTAGVRLIYSLDGWLVERQEYADLERYVAQGLDEEYFPQSKQRQVVRHFKEGKMEGELLSYYPSGKLKRRESYQESRSLGGQCFTEAGTPMAFVPYYVLPEYPGGLPALMQFIGTNTVYPRKALKAEQQARVFVHFVVNEQGAVTEARVAEPKYPLLDAEALRVVNRLGKWQPGRIEGEVKKISFTLPVTFLIQ